MDDVFQDDAFQSDAFQLVPSLPPNPGNNFRVDLGSCACCSYYYYPYYYYPYGFRIRRDRHPVTPGCTGIGASIFYSIPMQEIIYGKCTYNGGHTDWLDGVTFSMVWDDDAGYWFGNIPPSGNPDEPGFYLYLRQEPNVIDATFDLPCPLCCFCFTVQPYYDEPADAVICVNVNTEINRSVCVGFSIDEPTDPVSETNPWFTQQMFGNPLSGTQPFFTDGDCVAGAFDTYAFNQWLCFQLSSNPIP